MLVCNAAGMQEAMQLQKDSLDDQSQSQQQLQQKYTQLKAYTLDLQARKKGDAATIENLQIQLKQVRTVFRDLPKTMFINNNCHFSKSLV